jgi:myo-inositol-1(or 4)-monophosphatase
MCRLSARGCQLKILCDSIAVAVSQAIESMIGRPSSGIMVEMGADGTPTKSIDRVAENAVFLKLNQSGLGFKVISEERGQVLIGDEPKYFLHLDPLDGTYNAIKDIPFYSLSIYISKEKFSLGYVFDLARGTKYYAERGKGAYAEIHDKDLLKLQVSTTQLLRDFSISAYTIRPNTSRIVRLGDKVRRIRTLGSTSLEMALVACGKLDAFIDLRGMLRLVDVAAGILILEQAGGVITDSTGDGLHINEEMWRKTDLLGSNGRLHKELLELIGGGGN